MHKNLLSFCKTGPHPLADRVRSCFFRQNRAARPGVRRCTRALKLQNGCVPGAQ
nr:MAG TPA: hypothetical protein [Caudoviricetes sp.]